MGHKTHPIGYRLGYNVTWSSRWYASKDYAKLLHQDIKIRKMVKQRLFHAGVAKVEIERSGDQTRVIIHTARPGIIIGRKGAEVDKLKAELEKAYSGQVYITVKEIKKPELDAQLVCENVATQLEKRVAFRRAMKRSVQSALRLGAQGIKIMVGGRLGERRLRDQSGIAKAACLSIRSGRTSTMDLPKPIQRWGRSGSRPGFTRGRSFRCSPSRKNQYLTADSGN